MLQDKVAAARKIDSLLKNVIALGGFRLKYRITVNPPPAAGQDSSCAGLSGETGPNGEGHAVHAPGCRAQRGYHADGHVCHDPRSLG